MVAHETLFRKLWVWPGLGVLVSVQLAVLGENSPRVLVRPVIGLVNVPTAEQAVAVGRRRRTGRWRTSSCSVAVEEPGGAVPPLGQGEGVPAVDIVADRQAAVSCRAGHPVEGGGGRAAEAGDRLDGPGAAVPPLGQRRSQAADRGARRCRAARHGPQRPAGRGRNPGSTCGRSTARPAEGSLRPG